MDNVADGHQVTVAICGAFAIVVAPIYLFLRYFVSLVRQAYGFAEDTEDTGPEIRVCPGCDTSVLETDLDRCLACGTALPPIMAATQAPVKEGAPESGGAS